MGSQSKTGDGGLKRKHRSRIWRCSCWVLFTAISLGLLLTVTPARADQGRWLAREQILLYGLGLKVEPEHQTVPKDIATIVSTYLQAPSLPPSSLFPSPHDVEVRATLRGPSLSSPVQLVTSLNEPFEIPPLQRAGIHSLDNIRVVQGGEVLFYAVPESVTIQVIEQLLVTEVTARALTAEEIKDKGIVFDRTNFQAYNFTAAFAVKPGEEIEIDFPVLLPKLAPVQDVSLAKVKIPNISGPVLQKVSTIIPDTLKIAQTQIPNLTVRGFTLGVEEIEAQGFSIPPIPGVIVIPGDIGFLNQYFSVMLMVGNVAPDGSGLVVEDLQAEIVLPPGNDTVVGSGDDPLMMAVTEKGEWPRLQSIAKPGPDGQLGTADDEDVLAPGESGNAEFLVEGRREGSHGVEMEIAGTLTGLPVGPVTIRGRAAGAVLVRNPSFTLTFTHPEIVNDGEEYDLDVTVTNTSQSPANFVSVNLYSRNISGASLVNPEDNTREIETIPSEDSATVSFRLRSRVTGTVYASTLDSDEKVAGRFELKTVVGELGIPLSPDSLVLPKEAGSLPEDLRRAAVGLLGKAYATATAPASALPKDVKRFTKKMVWDRAVEVAEAGLRYSLHEPLSDSAKHLLLDMTGNGFSRLAEKYPDQDQVNDLEAAQKDFMGFDDLRRRSFRGDVLADAFSAILGEELQALGAGSFHQEFAEAVSYRPEHLSVLVMADEALAPLPYRLVLLDDQGRVLGTEDPETQKIKKEIPFSDHLVFENEAGQVYAQMSLVSVPQGTGYTIQLQRTVLSPDPVTLTVVLPAQTESGLRQVVFSGLTPGFTPVIDPAPGDPFTVSVEIRDEAGPVPGSAVQPTSAAMIPDPLPTVISAVQLAEADIVGCGGTGGPQLGRVVAVLFSEEVTAESAQDRFDRAAITNYEPEENEPVGVALQPGGRIVFLALRDSLGPFIERYMTISGVAGPTGQVMDPWTGIMEPTITEEGAVLSGKILRADGTPVDAADVRLYFWNGECGWHGVSAKRAGAQGDYGWDFVLKNRKGRIVAVDPTTEEFRAVEFQAGRHGQRLNVNVVFLGRATLQGRALAEDGFTPLEEAQFRVTSMTDYSTYGAKTDEEGWFVIPGIPVGGVLIEAVHVESNSQVTQSDYLPSAGETYERDLILLSEPTRIVTIEYGALSGHVLESDGATPASGLPVVVYYRTGSQEGVTCPHAGPPNWDCAVAFATTDDNGAFAFEEIPAGELRVYTFDQSRFIEGEARIGLPEDGEAEVNVLLSGGLGTVRGIVLDAAGNPVVRAEVGGGMTLTTTDEEGRFTLGDVPVGERIIVAVSEAVGSRGRATVDLVAEGEEVYATVVLAGTASITGTVYEPDGTTPIANMDVYLWYPGEGNEIVVAETAATDPEGHYRLDDVPLRDDYSLSAFLSDMSKGNIEPVELNINGQVKRVDITCIGRGSIEGVVLDDDGQTPLEAQVSLSELRLVRAGPVGVRYEYVQHSRVVENDFTTGEFSFSNVYVGPITLATGGAFNLMCKTIDVGGMPSDVLDPVTYSGAMPYDGATVEVPLQLQATSQISGTVFESDGLTPVGEGVQVTFRAYRIVCYPTGVCVEMPQGIQEETVVTDENGRYWLPMVTPWKFELVAQDPNTGKIGKAWGTTVPGQRADVPIRLLGLGDVAVTVFSGDGRTPIAYAEVDLEHAFIFGETLSLRENFGFSTVKRQGTADGDGTIVFGGGDAIPEGTFVVVARDPLTGYAGRASGKVTADGEQVEVNVYLFDATGSVSGIVYAPDGITPVANAEVIIRRMDDGKDLGFFVTDENGAYAFDSIPLGEFEITVFEPATGRRGHETARIDYDGQQIVVMVVEKGIGFVTGRVMKSGDLSPLSGWDLKLRQRGDRGDWIQWRATSGRDGSFMFPGITLGTFELIAEKGQDRAAIESRITRQGETVDIPMVVNLVADPVGTIEGIVYNPDGTLAANAEMCLDRCPPEGRGTTTDEYGTFRFGDVPLGRHEVKVSSQVGDDDGSALVDVDFAGRMAFTTVVLDGLGTISGIVEDQSGDPVPGAQVGLYLGSATPERTVYADGIGAFSFIQLSSNRYTLVAAHPTTGLSGSSSVVLALGRDEQVRVVLEPTFSITGTVVSSGAVPLQGIMVTLEHSEHLDPNNASALLRLFAETGSDGLFAFAAVPTGQCTITFEDPIGIGYAERTRTVLEAIDLGTIVLDDTFPAVLSMDPGPGAVGVPMDRLVRITFSEQMNPGTINLNTLTLTRDDGQKVNGYLTMTDGDTVVTLTPLAPLADETRYTLRLSADPPFASLDGNEDGSVGRVEAARFFAVLVHFDEYDADSNGVLSEDEYPGGIEDRFGHGMERDFVASFTTVDITPPFVQDASPAPNTGGVSVNTVIRIVYSEPVDPSAFSGPAVALLKDGVPVEGRVDMILGNTGVVFTPQYPLSEDTQYQVSLAPAADLSGNAQAEGLAYLFSTTDRTPPQVQSLALSGGGTVVEGGVGTVAADVGSAYDVSFIDFYINDVLVLTDRQAPFEMNFEASPGLGTPGETLLVSAVATDTSGNRGAAYEASFTIVEDAPPAAQIAVLSPGLQANTGQRVELSVSAEDDLGLTTIAYQAVGGQHPAYGNVALDPPELSSSAEFAFYVPINAVPGSVITIHASAVDTKGLTGHAGSIEITVLDATNPAVRFAGLTTGERVRPGEVITAVVEATDPGGVASVTFEASGATVHSDTRLISPAQTSVAATFSFAVSPAALPTQSVTLEAVAEDAAGNTSTRARVVLPIADLMPPVVSLDTQTGLHEAAPGQIIALVVNASDEAAVERIELSASGAITYSDAQQVSPPASDAQAVFQVMIPGGVPQGATISFEATAVDTSGNRGDPALLTVTIRSAVDITLAGSLVMIAGEREDVTVELGSPAPAGGLTVSLASEDSTIAMVQPSLTIPEGRTSGTFEVNPVRGGTTVINASVQGAPGASMTVTVRGGVVTGRVLNENLDPVGGADLTINGIAVTSEPVDGSFFVEGVPGRDVEIRVFDPLTLTRGYWTGSMNVAGGYLHNVVVVMIPAGTITGTVYLPDLVTPAGQGVRVDLYPHPRYSFSDPVKTVFTDEDGRFEFPLVAVGDYDVDVSDVSGNRGRKEVVIGASGEEHDILVAFLGRGTVRVSVTDGVGSEVSNAALTFRGRSIFGDDYRVETAGLDGTFEFTGVFIGEFSITALDPVTEMGARASGTISSHGQVVELTMQTGWWASIQGTVYRADGTPVPWAELMATGYARATADENGAYRFDILPLGTYVVRATDEATRGIGTGEVTLDANGQTAQLDITLLGQGTLIVTVEDSEGALVPDAQIELWEKIEEGAFRRLYQTRTNEGGLAVVDHVLEGRFRIMAESGIYASPWVYGDLLRDQVLDVTLTLEPTATLQGTVYGPDGETPEENVKVRVVQVVGSSPAGWIEYITGADGTYRFENLPLGMYLLEAYEGGTIDAFGNYVGGQLRARIRDIPVNVPSEVVTADVVLVGLGTVTGQVFMPGGADTAPDMPVTLRSLTPDYGKTWSLRTDGAGYYTVERVPVGDFIVSSGDINQGVYGEEQGGITFDGETIGVDIVLQSNAVTLPLTLYDGNVVRFDIQQDGTLDQGQNSVFNQYYYGTVKGGGAFEIVSDGTAYPFSGGEVPVQEGMGREIVVRQNGLAGLNVTRKIYIPREGYFARYLEILSNPTDQPITADIVVTSNLNYTLNEFHIITTSSGDDVIQSQGADAPDTWVVIDDNNSNDPFLVTSFNRPPVAFVWAGPDGAVAPDSVGFVQRTGNTAPAHVMAQWSQVTLDPGETKAFMHCIVQQLSREAAQASAERLVQVPPELLAGLSLSEMAMVQNFAVPADGSSALPSLPGLSGIVSGQALASDGTTPAPYGYTTDVLIKSDSIYYGRTYITHPDTSGFFLFESDLTGNPSYDDVLGIPLEGFTLSARVCRGSYCSYTTYPQYYVISPEVTGVLAKEQPAAELDILFSNTGIIQGTVTRATGTVVSGAEVSVDMPPYSVEVGTAQDGSYLAAFLAPGPYQVEVSAEGIPDQGYPIRAEGSGTVHEGGITIVDISLPPLGTITGGVTGPDGNPMNSVRVVLRETEGDYFTRETRTDGSGQFTLYDVPVGTYAVTAYDPATNGTQTFTVTVEENQTSTVDFPMPAFTTLPITLYDLGGYTWDIQQNGRIRYGTANAYNYGLELSVSNLNASASFYGFGSFFNAITEEDGREVLIGPYTNSTLGPIQVKRKVFVPDDDSFARYLEILENTGDQDVNAQIQIHTRLGSSSATQIIGTSLEDGLFDAFDDYIVTDDAADGSGTPAMTHVFSGPGAAIEPAMACCPCRVGSSTYPEYVRYSYDVTIPAGGRVIIMHFASQNATQADALANAENLLFLSGSALNGLSQDEQADIVNFVAYPDSDSDGLTDDQEALYGTDPNDLDSDDDGLLDGWEVRYGFDPLEEGEQDLDTDGDDLDNLSEQLYGTDPLHPDTDGDGLLDGWEVVYGFNPLVIGQQTQDPDEDGLDNLGEQTAGTNPFIADTDGDGLLDGAEVYTHGTDPNNSDSDNDGLFDGFEVSFGFDPLSDPGTGEGQQDPDSDGVDNFAEQAAGTNPVIADTDGDGLADGEELNTHGTDPLNWDSDGGGRSDGGEVLEDGTNPLDPTDDRLAIRLTDGSAISDQAASAVDSQGRVHLVWVDRRTGNDEIFYSLLSPAGETLMNATQLTLDTAQSKRPAIAVDSRGRAHIAWHDKRLSNTPEVIYTVIDPARDDLDGSAGDEALITVVDDYLLSANDGDRSSIPRLAVDSADRVHMVWSEEDTGDIRYERLALNDTDNSVVVEVSRTLFSGGGSRWYPTRPVLALDSQENVHVVWMDHRDTSAVELYFEMLDGGTGATLIDETVVTANDGEDAQFPSIGIGPGDEITVVFQEYHQASYEVFMLRLDPKLDDRDGGSADVSRITVLQRTMVSGDDQVDSVVPMAVVDRQGKIRIAYYDTTARYDFYPGTVILRVLDQSGGLTRDATLTWGASADTQTDWTLPFVSLRGITSYVSWSDTQFGGLEAVLRILDPDADGDGLSEPDEVAAGTDSFNPDTDGDGLLDGFEVRYGLDPRSETGAGEADQDPDGDGLSNLEEQTLGTNPANPDTDGDGLADSDELPAGADPNRPDTDNDGLRDGEEVHTWNSNPTLVDSDGDGLWDGFEAIYGFDPAVAGEQGLDLDTDGLNNLTEQNLKTNPTVADTDMDDLTDGDEVNVWNTDPLDPDTDEDGLRDGFEVAYGMNPRAGGDETLDPDDDGLSNLDEQNWGANPLDPDTDDDGLLDGWEAGYGFDPTVEGEQELDSDGDDLNNLEEQTYGTDPTIQDTDWDMLTDGEEVQTYGTVPTMWDTDMDQLSDGEEVQTHGTLPTNPDTDGGGRTDGQEINLDGTDPLDPGDDMAPIRITEGEGTADRSAVATDGNGNIHVVWQDNRTGIDQIYYAMLAPDKSFLIDHTRLTEVTTGAYSAALAVGAEGHIHIVWEDTGTGEKEIFHMAIDPYLDPMDGTPAEVANITVAAAHMISTDDNIASTDPRLASDSLGRLHAVWADTGAGEVHYTRLGNDGSIQIADQLIFDAGAALTWGRALPVVALDANDDVHLAWMHRPSGSIELFYAMLDGDSPGGGSANVLIGTTALTPSDGYDTRYPSIGIGPGNEITVAYESKGLIPSGWGPSYPGCKVAMMRINPALDDQNGNAAVVGSITTLTERSIEGAAFSTAVPVSAAVDGRGNVYAAYYSSYSESYVPPRGYLYFVVLNSAGMPITDRRYLTEGNTATTTGILTLPAVFVDGSKACVGWTDDRSGTPEIFLQILP